MKKIIVILSAAGLIITPAYALPGDVPATPVSSNASSDASNWSTNGTMFSSSETTAGQQTNNNQPNPSNTASATSNSGINWYIAGPIFGVVGLFAIGGTLYCIFKKPGSSVQTNPTQVPNSEVLNGLENTMQINLIKGLNGRYINANTALKVLEEAQNKVFEVYKEEPINDTWRDFLSPQNLSDSGHVLNTAFEQIEETNELAKGEIKAIYSRNFEIYEQISHNNPDAYNNFSDYISSQVINDVLTPVRGARAIYNELVTKKNAQLNNNTEGEDNTSFSDPYSKFPSLSGDVNNNQFKETNENGMNEPDVP